MLLANKHYIRKISMDGNLYELAGQGYDNVVNMDIDIANQMVRDWRCSSSLLHHYFRLTSSIKLS